MEQLSQSFVDAATLMFAGMIFVFAFLGLLVVFIKTVLTPLASKYPDPKPKAKKSSQSIKNHQGVEPSVVAAIGAAVSQYRNNADKN